MHPVIFKGLYTCIGPNNASAQKWDLWWRKGKSRRHCFPFSFLPPSATIVVAAFFCLRLFSGPPFPSPLLLSRKNRAKKEEKEKKKRVVPFSLLFFADEKPHYLGHLIFIAPVPLFFLCVCAFCCVSLRVPRTLGFVLIIFPPLLRQRSE